MSYLTPEESAYIKENRKLIRKLEERMAKVEERLPEKDMLDFSKMTRKQINLLKNLYPLGEFNRATGNLFGYSGRAFGRHINRFIELGIVEKIGRNKYRIKAYKNP